MSNKDRVKIFWGKDKSNWNFDLVNKIFKNKNVYITFDVDGFDSSIMPATGTPEPGGLMWHDALLILKNISKISNVVGADINELSIKNFNSYNFLVAKLAYKMLRIFLNLNDKFIVFSFQDIFTDAPPKRMFFKKDNFANSLSRVLPRKVPSPVPEFDATCKFRFNIRLSQNLNYILWKSWAIIRNRNINHIFIT